MHRAPFAVQHPLHDHHSQHPGFKKLRVRIPASADGINPAPPQPGAYLRFRSRFCFYIRFAFTLEDAESTPAGPSSAQTPTLFREKLGGKMAPELPPHSLSRFLMSMSMCEERF
ncbi:hypothetical protein MSAN_00557200 [Mycena sanguinolenta]|uniref:Uncharacterized protein n=1 Tax=Mycena sanguinolenta TaxID=230812 RepID=A0A8H6ZD36_9AGAR|nr:hypothetical protein MSAN_00557200 [Mycena sanguinolenta]